MIDRQVILASQSPQRKAILSTLFSDFLVIPADIDEQAITASSQTLRAEHIARAKAEKISAQQLQAVVIAGDTFVIDAEDNPLEKPADKDEAVQMLSFQSGKELTEVTGVAYLDPVMSIDFSTTVSASFRFRELTQKEIRQFVETEPVTTWSAAFCPAYDSSLAMIASVNGSLSSFTHGLPVEIIQPLLVKSGILS